MENVEQLNSDVPQDSPSESQTPPAVETKTDSPVESTSPKQETSKEVPFHEHPRWKEIIAERNESRAKLEAMERQFQELQKEREAQLKARQQAEDPNQKMLERLKSIDPEFAKFMESQYEAARQVQELNQWRMQAEQQRQVTEAQNALSQLHNQFKVESPKMQDTYRRIIQAMATENPRLGVKDLPALYKQVHEMFSERESEIKRAERESYLKDKQADSKVPVSQPKGKPVNPSQKPQAPKDPIEARRAMIEAAAKAIRQSRPENV